MRMKPLWQLAEDLAEGRTTSAALTAQCFDRIEDPDGEGARAFIRLFKDAAMDAAEASDRARGHGIVPSPLAGIPVSIKDLCDVRGYTTLAGSKALADRPPAEADAPVVARLRAAGAVVLGTTNMTEFAFGALGLNPHYDTPRNPWDRATGRIPGGSSSGAAVSVSDGMAAVALGSDTAGSVRMPAGFCGITGFKPTTGRIPIDGLVPLAATLDSVGPLGNSVQCCALVDAIFAGQTPEPVAPHPVEHATIAVPKRLVCDDLDDAVASGFEAALRRLSAAGARLVDIEFAELDEIAPLNAGGTLPIMEGLAWHRELLAEKGELYDPIIAQRLRNGAGIPAHVYLDLLAARRDLIARADAVTAPYDAVAMPTLAWVAPPILAIGNSAEEWLAANSRTLRNTFVGNFLDRCAITLPCHEPGSGPVGLMLMGARGGDAALLSLAAGVEDALTGR